MDERIIRLEEKLMELEKCNDDIDEVVRALADQVDALRRQMQRLEANVTELAQESEEEEADG